MPSLHWPQPAADPDVSLPARPTGDRLRAGIAAVRLPRPELVGLLVLAAALWFVVRGLEDGRTRWLMLAGACVGLGFEAKMAAALLIVPALAAAWMWVAPRGRIAALRQLLAGGAAMVVVGGAWPLLMLLT